MLSTFNVRVCCLFSHAVDGLRGLEGKTGASGLKTITLHMGAVFASAPREIASEEEDVNGLLRCFIEEYERSRRENNGEVNLASIYATLSARLTDKSDKLESGEPEGYAHVMILDGDATSSAAAGRVLELALGCCSSTSARASMAEDVTTALRLFDEAGDARRHVVLVDAASAGNEVMEALWARDDAYVVILVDESEPQDYQKFLDQGAQEVLPKPITVRKAAQVLLRNDVRFSKPSDDVRDAWSTPLANGDDSLTLETLAGTRLLVGFVTSLKSDAASRNLTWLLTLVAPALKEHGVTVVVLCIDDDAAMEAARTDHVTLVADTSLAVSAAYVGLATDAATCAPGPRTGLVVFDETKSVLERMLMEATAASDDQLFAETCCVTTTARAGKHAGRLSLAHFVDEERASMFGFDVMASATLAPLKDSALSAARVSLKVKDNPEGATTATIRKHVLVVEDSAMTANTMAKRLLSAGHVVACASDGCEALLLLRKFAAYIDCVLTDVVMPRMDGVELLSKLKDETPSESIPVILVTSLETNTDQVAILIDELGAERILRKPVKFKRLIEVVDACPLRH